jgi:PII-like signaling protein
MAKREFEAKMVRIHLSESDKWHDQPVHEAILSKCLELGISSVMVYRGVEGFGDSARVHHARSWPFSKDAPIMVSVIDSASQVDSLLPHLDSMVSEGIVAISDVHVVLYTSEPSVPESR